MDTIRRYWSWLADEPRHRVGARILQVAIGMMLWFRMATEFRYADFFWGPRGIGTGDARVIFGPWLGGKLGTLFHTDMGTRLVVLVLCTSALLLILGKATRIASAVALVATLMLEVRLPELLDGGDNITRVVLCYALFLAPPNTKPKRGGIVTFLHNVAVLAIAIQLCILYVTAGFMKAGGTRWSQGTALYLVSQVEWFSQPATRWIFRNPLITTVASYVTIFFQLWFPVAILSRLKILWVFIGIGMHLGIAYTMGLIPFSTIMIGLELFLIGDDEWVKARALLRPLYERAVVVGTGLRAKLTGSGGTAHRVDPASPK